MDYVSKYYLNERNTSEMHPKSNTPKAVDIFTPATSN